MGSKPKRKERAYRSAVLVLVPVVFCAFGLMIWFALRSLYTENERFIIRDIQIESVGDGIMTRAKLKEYTEVDVGINLFGFGIGKVRRQILDSVPNIREFEIERHLPDTLKITVIERQPVARIGDSLTLIDDTGYVFYKGRKRTTLPMITGIEGRDPVPGDSLDGRVMDALRLLDVCAKDMHELGQNLRIESIDIRHPDYLLLRLQHGEPVQTARIDWSDVTGDKTDLIGKLSLLHNRMRIAASRNLFHKTMDLRYDNVTAN
jgi:cell division septal protein FtsQ